MNDVMPQTEKWSIWKIDAWADGECDGEVLWVWNDKQRIGVDFYVPTTASRADIDGAFCDALPKDIAAIGLVERWANDCVLEYCDQMDGERPVYAAILDEVADV